MRELLYLTSMVACLWLRWITDVAKNAAIYAAAGVLYALAHLVGALTWLFQIERFNAWCEARRARQAEAAAQRKITARRRPLPTTRDTRGDGTRA